MERTPNATDDEMLRELLALRDALLRARARARDFYQVSPRYERILRFLRSTPGSPFYRKGR